MGEETSSFINQRAKQVEEKTESQIYLTKKKGSLLCLIFFWQVQSTKKDGKENNAIATDDPSLGL